MTKKKSKDEKPEEHIPEEDHTRITAADEVDQIITSHVVYSMVLAAIPIPVLDIIGVTGVQVDMIKQIAEKYSVDFDKESGKSLVTSLITATFANTLGRMGASLVKGIPGLGTVVGIAGQVVLSGASTYALGKAFEKHFVENEDFLTINFENLKETYRSFLKKGEKVARDLNKESNENILATLEKLNNLKEQGAITAEEYEDLKKKLIGRL